MEFAAEFTVRWEFYVDALVEAESYEIQGLLLCIFFFACHSSSLSLCLKLDAAYAFFLIIWKWFRNGIIYNYYIAWVGPAFKNIMHHHLIGSKWTEGSSYIYLCFH